MKMDVARVLVRTSCNMALNGAFDVNINGDMLCIKMVEDFYGPLRISVPSFLSKQWGVPEDEADFDDSVEESDEDVSKGSSKLSWKVEGLVFPREEEPQSDKLFHKRGHVFVHADNVGKIYSLLNMKDLFDRAAENL
ncbi:unnamed protein product [Lathyrus sativus]|nr:unnamed protein product [Lathyrus sativus]